MATYNIYGIGAALVDTDAGIFDCGNKQGL